MGQPDSFGDARACNRTGAGHEVDSRENVKVDRVACPWLIKRHVDPDAEFYFVPAPQVMPESVDSTLSRLTCPALNSDTTAKSVPSKQF